MGTRSLTVFEDQDNKEIAVMYRQFDGYPDGHGQALADYLRGKRLVNGFQEQDRDKAFNGMPCLAASVVAHFKEGIGNFYLYPAGTRGCGEDYIYTISAAPGGAIRLRVESPGDAAVFDGPVNDFDSAKLVES